MPYYVRSGNKDRVIVFVHGVFGGPETWNCRSGQSWPKMLADDDVFKGADIYVTSYDTPYFGNRMTLDEIVANMNSRFDNDRVFSGHREVVFVCHSMGGLVTQRLLLTHREYAAQVPFIYFFSTPETGAQIAKIGRIFSADPLLKAMIPGDENDYLLNLENEWLAAGFGKVHRYCAYEKKPMKGVLVVDRLSGTRNCESSVPINEDHAGIAKPCSAADDSYIALRNAWLKNPVKPEIKPSHPVAMARAPAGDAGKVTVSVALYAQTGELVGSADRPPVRSAAPAPPDLTVSYYERAQGPTVHIGYSLPYLDLLRKGGPVRGLFYKDFPFEWRFPELLVTVGNNTNRTLHLTKLVLNVKSSRIEDEPIPVIDDLSQGGLLITNQGWGAIIDPVLQLTIREDGGDVALFAPKPQTLTLPTFEDAARVPIGNYVPDRLRNADVVRVEGQLSYGAAGQRKTLAFTTRVTLGVRAGKAAMPDYEYNAFLKAGETGPVELELIPRREVAAGALDVIPVRIRSDKSANHRLEVSFRTNGGELIRGVGVALDIFVPRARLPVAQKPVGGAP